MSSLSAEKEENIIRRVLSKEATMVLSIIGIVIGVTTWVTTPERANSEQIAYLKSVIEKNQIIQETLTKTQQNDLHTLEGKYEQQLKATNELTNQIIRLNTIIEERIPAKSSLK